MRKNRLIALIGTLTMAAAGLAAVSAGVSSKKAEGVSAVNKVDKDCYTFYVIDQVYATNDGRDLKIHMWDINIDSSMGFDSSNLRADFDNAGCINDFVRASLDSSSLTIDSYFDWQQDISTGKEWKLTIPWYVTSFKYKLYAGSYWATDGDQTMSTKSYYNIYLCNGTWNSWKTSVVKESYSSKDNVSQFAISAACTPSDAGSATVKGNGGSAVGSGNYFERQKITAKATANSGYAFSSWSDSGTAEHTFYASQDVALTANFTANSYTVTLNPNEGTGGPSSVTATYGAAMPSLSSLPSRVGYIFDGYWDSATAGTQYYADNGTSVKNWDKASTATLYAHWTPNPKTPYTVKHYQQNPDDLSAYLLSGTDSLSGTTGTQTNAEARSTAGFTAQPFSQQTIAADGSTEVNINYNRNLYTMTYDYGEATGEITPPKENDQIYYGCTPTQSGVSVPQPEWSGHDFNGWKYTDYGQDLDITNSTPYGIADNITVHAQWSLTPVSSYSVSFVIADGQSSWGSLSSSTGSTTLSVAADSTISVNNNVMTIDGKSVTATAATDSTGQYSYAFKSFSPNSGTINADTVITVEFSQTTNQYSLAWDFDEGTPEGSYSPAGDYNWGSTIVIPTNVSKEGCSFDGLFFDSDFTNPCDDDFELKQNTTVYAKFTGLTYDVSVGVDSSCTGWGTVSSTIVEDVPYNTSISASNNVLTVGQTQITATAKTGPEATYSFLRWDGIPASEKVTGDLNIKAVFSKVDTKCQLTWDFAGGSTSDTEYTVSGSYVYGTRINAPTTASMSKDGYTFAGWDNEVASTLTSDQTYTAQWVRENGYYIHVFGDNERYVKMSSNGGTEYVGTIDLEKGETFKITTITDGSEGLWSGWSAVKYDTGDGPHVDARSNAQVVDDGSDNHNIKANLAGTNTYKVFYDTNESWIDDVGGYHTYIPSIVNVEFDLNGKTGTAPANQIAYARGHVTEPEDPTTTESYEFEGWYGEAACTNKWNFDENQLIYFSVDSSTHVATQKIYANWISTASYDITLNNNGGTGGETSINDVHVGDEISVASIPTKLNNTFTGYYTIGGTQVINNDGSNKEPYQESFGTTLNAGWTVNNGTYIAKNPSDTSMNGQYAMTENPDKAGEFLIQMSVTSGDKFKVYYANNGSVNWDDATNPTVTYNNPVFKDKVSFDTDKNLVINSTGDYTIYFNTTTKNYHVADLTLPENGRYFVINGVTTKGGLIPTERIDDGWTGVEYKAKLELDEGDLLSAFYQDATQATEYDLILQEGSVKEWDTDPETGALICPEDGMYSLYMISKDGGTNYNYVGIYQEGEEEAITFAQTFLNAMKDVCILDDEGHVSTDPSALASAWSALYTGDENPYSKLSDNAKALLRDMTGDSESSNKIKQFAASYDYIYGKYHETAELHDFAGRDPVVNSASRLFSVNNVSTSTWIIASVAIVGIAAVGVFFIYRKRKEN